MIPYNLYSVLFYALKVAMSSPTVNRIINKLGKDLKEARLRRRISVHVMSDRASISRATLNRIEKGEGGVSIAAYIAVLYALRLHEGIENLADLKNDPTGIEISKDQLPKRIRKSKKK